MHAELPEWRQRHHSLGFANGQHKQAVEILRFKVRSGDWLEVNCSRENKDGCNPLSTVRVGFQRAIDPKDAARFRLRDDAGKLYSPKG